MKRSTITYNCEKCGMLWTVAINNLRHRKHHKNKYICRYCLIKLEKQKAIFDALPAETHHQVFAGQLDYNLANKYLRNVRTKILIDFNCRSCGIKQSLRWSDMCRRKHYRYEDLCVGCLNNLIQNDEEKLKSNSEKSKLLWRDDNYRRACLRAFEEHNERMQYDTEYSEKHRRRSRSISGIILIDDREIRFDSGYELIFIWYAIGKYAKVRRCGFAIAYDNHFYHPDFLVVDTNGTKTIIEVKGFYKNNVAKKQRAAERYILETGVADSYVLYDTERLIKDGILIKIGSKAMWQQIREINNNATITFTDPKHQRIAEIGIGRYRKEIKNQQNFKASIHGEGV